MSISNGFPGTVKLASKTGSGLMSSSDKIKLDSINPVEIKNAKETIKLLKNIIVPNKIYTVRIDLTERDPYLAVSYINDAVGFEPLTINQNSGECNYGSWKDVIDKYICPRPCLYKSSQVISYLDSSNYSRNIYGTGVNIIAESSGDVMVEFSKLYYKLEMNGTNLDFSICTSTTKPNNTWCCDAFLSEDGLNEESNYMYYGAYEGWVDDDNKLRSLSDKIPTANKTISEYRTYAQNNGSGYTMLSISKRMYITFLNILVTKSLSLKTYIGYGVSDLQYTGDNRAIKTGTMNTKGLFYGDRTGINGIKVFGIENFIGNLAEFVDGLIKVENALYCKKSYPYNNTGSSYTLIGNYPTSETSGWLKSVAVSNNLLIPKELNATSNTYFTSFIYLPTDNTLTYFCTVGGSYYMNLSCDNLCMDFRYELENKSQATGSRLIYTKQND